MQWIKDPVAEKQLADLGAEWTYSKGVLISSLKVAASLKNNARIGKAINDDTVLAYAYQLEEGAPFPAIVTTPQGQILAGNHRVAAAILAGNGGIQGKSIDCYVITNGTKGMYDQFTRTDNTRHGEKLTEEQMIQHCIHLHMNYKTPLTELNRKWFGKNSRTYTKLQNAWYAHKVSQILNEEAIDADKLSPGAKAKLYMLAPSKGGGIQNLKLLKKMAKTAIRGRYTDTEVSELTKVVKKSPDEKSGIDAIKAYDAARTKPQSQRAAANPVRSRFLSGVSGLKNFFEKGVNGAKLTSLNQLDLTDEQIREVAKTFTKLSKVMADLKRQAKKK